MATQEYAASIQGVGIRVTRLDASGNPLNGPGDSYTTAAFIRVSFTPEYEAGDEITQKNANGAVGVSYKAPDTLKRITLELAITEPDPELTSLLAGGLLLTKNDGTFGAPERKSIGWAAPAVGDDPSGFGVSVEAWSLAVKDGKKASVRPFFHWIFPYAKFQQTGDRVIENGLLATVFQGYGLGNVKFGTGLDERWEYPVATDRPYSYARTGWAPSGLQGFYTWHGALTAAISNKAVQAGSATITTSSAHGFAIGEEVTITSVGLNGTRTITGVPTATTFTFTDSNLSDITSTAATGSATVPAGPRAIAALPVSLNPDTYNVPGNANYNADLASDFVIASAEDPTN